VIDIGWQAAGMASLQKIGLSEYRALTYMYNAPIGRYRACEPRAAKRSSEPRNQGRAGGAWAWCDVCRGCCLPGRSSRTGEEGEEKGEEKSLPASLTLTSETARD
jgi:hypothetical protein